MKNPNRNPGSGTPGRIESGRTSTGFPSGSPFSLYLHIPFCERKCIYCDFYSVERLKDIAEFLNALHREIDLRSGDWSNYTAGTVFFGGGTPSLLSPAEIFRIMDHLRSAFRIAPDPEVTLEANPGTIGAAKLEGYRKAGINRISIGIQSFDENDLRFLGRIHNRDQAIRAVDDARKAGFDNLNIDLIYALPGQTVLQWRSTLEQAADLSPDHISAYGLIVEDRTPLSRLVRSKQVSPASSDEEAEFFEFTMSALEGHGYEHYEVSNYARPGHRSLHNLNYWRHGDYLGLGPSAHSYRHSPGSGHRWWNAASIGSYISRLASGALPVAGEEQLSGETMMIERLFLGLRSDGIDLHDFKADFGERILSPDRAIIQDFLREGLLQLSGDRLSLTSRGYLVCDEVSVQIAG